MSINSTNVPMGTSGSIGIGMRELNSGSGLRRTGSLSTASLSSLQASKSSSMESLESSMSVSEGTSGG